MPGFLTFFEPQRSLGLLEMRLRDERILPKGNGDSISDEEMGTALDMDKELNHRYRDSSLAGVNIPLLSQYSNPFPNLFEDQPGCSSSHQCLFLDLTAETSTSELGVPFLLDCVCP